MANFECPMNPTQVFLRKRKRQIEGFKVLSENIFEKNKKSNKKKNLRLFVICFIEIHATDLQK